MSDQSSNEQIEAIRELMTEVVPDTAMVPDVVAAAMRLAVICGDPRDPGGVSLLLMELADAIVDVAESDQGRGH